MIIQPYYDMHELDKVLANLQRIATKKAVQEAAKIALKDIRTKTAKGIGYDNQPFVGYKDERWMSKRKEAGLPISRVTLSYRGTMLDSIALRKNILGPSPGQMLKAVGNQENTRQTHRNRKFIGAGDDTLLKIENRIASLCRRAGQ